MDPHKYKNRYVYCTNNPINFIDPLGLDIDDDQDDISEDDFEWELLEDKGRTTIDPEEALLELLEGKNENDNSMADVVDRILTDAGIKPKEKETTTDVEVLASAMEDSSTATATPAPTPTPPTTGALHAKVLADGKYPISTYQFIVRKLINPRRVKHDEGSRGWGIKHKRRDWKAAGTTRANGETTIPDLEPGHYVIQPSWDQGHGLSLTQDRIQVKPGVFQIKAGETTEITINVYTGYQPI